MGHPAAAGRQRLQALVAIVYFLAAVTATAEVPATLTPAVSARIDAVAAKVLAETGVPSASVAVVKDGGIVYVKAYGDARLAPRMPASPTMRYSIGSISKQFTATAIVLVAEEKRLSLDDR